MKQMNYYDKGSRKNRHCLPFTNFYYQREYTKFYSYFISNIGRYLNHKHNLCAIYHP